MTAVDQSVSRGEVLHPAGTRIQPVGASIGQRVDPSEQVLRERLHLVAGQAICSSVRGEKWLFGLRVVRPQHAVPGRGDPQPALAVDVEIPDRPRRYPAGERKNLEAACAIAGQIMKLKSDPETAGAVLGKRERRGRCRQTLSRAVLPESPRGALPMAQRSA